MTFIILLLIFSVIVVNFPILFKYRPNVASYLTETIVSFLFLIFVFVRPPDICPDTSVYQFAFDHIDYKNVGFSFLQREPITSFEYGFYYLMMVFKHYFHLSFFSFSVFLSIFSLICVHKSVSYYIKKIQLEDRRSSFHVRYLYVFGCYLVYFGLFYNFITIRAMLSIDFLLLMSIAVDKRQWFKMILYFLFAFMIHRMAIIGLLFIAPLYRNKPYLTITKFKIILVILTILFFLEWQLNFITNVSVALLGFITETFNYTNYSKNNPERGLARMLQIVFHLINAWVIFYYLFTSYNKKNIPKTLMKIVTIYSLGLIVMVFISKLESAYRIFDYFFIFSVFLNCYILCNHLYLYKSFWRFCSFMIMQNLFLLISFRTFCMKFLIVGN